MDLCYLAWSICRFLVMAGLVVISRKFMEDAADSLRSNYKSLKDYCEPSRLPLPRVLCATVWAAGLRGGIYWVKAKLLFSFDWSCAAGSVLPVNSSRSAFTVYCCSFSLLITVGLRVISRSSDLSIVRFLSERMIKLKSFLLARTALLLSTVIKDY